MDTYLITALTILVSATAGVLTISTGIMAVNRILTFTKHRKGIHQKQTRFQDLGTHQAVFRLTQTNDIPDMRYKTQTIQELMQTFNDQYTSNDINLFGTVTCLPYFQDKNIQIRMSFRNLLEWLAAAGLSGDDRVFNVDIPQPIHLWSEPFHHGISTHFLASTPWNAQPVNSHVLYGDAPVMTTSYLSLCCASDADAILSDIRKEQSVSKLMDDARSLDEKLRNVLPESKTPAVLLELQNIETNFAQGKIIPGIPKDRWESNYRPVFLELATRSLTEDQVFTARSILQRVETAMILDDHKERMDTDASLQSMQQMLNMNLISDQNPIDKHPYT